VTAHQEARSEEDRDPSHPPAESPPRVADGTETSPIRVPRPAVEDEEEMGGEAPCQLHRFWDVPE
jgi:hypothetical protein